MSAGRRGLMLSIAFLVLATGLCPARRASAQPPGRFQQGGFPPHAADPQQTGKHTIWQQNLDPGQIRSFLEKFGQNDGKGDWLEDLLRRSVKEKNPELNQEQADAAIKKLLNNKEFMDRMTDLAQKHKNQQPNNGNNGAPPRLTQEDLAKLSKLLPEAPNGDPFRVPEPLPPFHPLHPQFDPQKFPKIDRENPPRFDPKTKFPLDPDTGRPFDPQTGKPIDPDHPPPIDPPTPPKFAPAPEPKTGRPMDPVPPNAQNGPHRFDKDNPLGAPPEPPEKVAKTKAAEAATALWEKNVGPIDETPAVKRAILDLVSDTDAMDALTDEKGNNFLDSLKGDGKDDNPFGNLFGGDSGWEWPKFDFNWSRGRDLDLDIGSGRSPNRDTPTLDAPRGRGGSFSGGLEFGSVRVPWLLVLVLVALIVAALVWWKWDALVPPTRAAVVANGPGEWPIDPRQINTREDVVKAFEFLSVLICGPEAKTWTHSTIADELTALAATRGETALKLARLYELARYAPLDEPLTRVELIEARRLVCDLAGMDEV
ncbi:hypothetical protein [Frigoriglobus tundricola]|uniref:DUF4129 domain-containing protein n=1 Tax=Frigoriglobus tundricola TaxID=2774151 RepID=A0A6M5YIU9_9BACT|nr:hypothetical protein [Frigoriglobus tundricola]QJW93474.1 hypothetical protein FTUN_0980 [Frigoriglobus tundricola]